LEQRFTRAEVERMTGATRRQLDYWARLGLLYPRARWGEKFFSFADLVAIETLGRLAKRRVPARRVMRAVGALQQQLGRARSPLASLRISTNGTQIVVHESGAAGRPIEPLSGQFVLDFEVAPIQRKIRALGERTAEEWFELGMTWDTNGDTLAEAARAYSHAVEASPDWVDAHINLGNALYRLNRLEESRDAFTAAVRLDPGNALAHFNLGCVWDRMGQTDPAIEEFRAAVSHSPQMADAHLNLALACEKTGREAEALRHFSLYLRYDPQGPWSDFARRRLRTVRGSPAGKVTPFRKTGQKK
jgi:tetratricopeptide (TPR) repeat protein